MNLLSAGGVLSIDPKLCARSFCANMVLTFAQQKITQRRRASIVQSLSVHCKKRRVLFCMVCVAMDYKY